MTLEKAYHYYKDRISEVSKFSSWGDVWVFLMCSSFIEYLVKMVNNEDKVGSKKYIAFIREYLTIVDPRYSTFKYNNGECDLPEQMYYILRCGIVHSFSLIPDTKGKKKNARARSILLSHEKNGGVHLERFNGSIDAVIFTAEGFCRDLDSLVEYIFKKHAFENKEIEENIISWLTHYPPIAFLSGN